jgi:Aspartate/tyrosine/aromatic aminotransferase
MTGWRIGYVAGPKEAMAKISDMQDHSTSCPNSIAQAAAVTALQGGDACVEEMKKEFSARRDYLVQRIKGIKKLSAVVPQGAFYVFCNIARTGLDSMEFSRRLLEEASVAVVPGIAFGDDRYIRFSFATSKEKIAKGLDRIQQWVGQL